MIFGGFGVCQEAAFVLFSAVLTTFWRLDSDE